MAVARGKALIFIGLLGAVAALAARSPADSATPATQSSANADEAWFNEHVLPVLSKNCFECHSHASGKLKGGLSLDWRSGWERGGESGPAIVPGSPEKSLLIKAIRRADDNLQMPPKKALAAEEVALLEEWVRRGAPDPRVSKPGPATRNAQDWWSLKPLRRPAVPVAEGVKNPIDAFIRAKLAENGLATSPPADRRTLIRRLTFDLHGLPPTPEEVESFVKDDSPDAYERLVDRLLASPRYGERWARHWFDVIHFADTHGFEHDVFRENAWRYRDYVIAAFNADTPWSRFIREQLAADVFYPAEPKLTEALGFLGAGPLDLSAAGTAPKMFEYQDRDDMVTQVMTSFASATVNCARCHDHKFDPISQDDYYALQAVFAGIGKGNLEYDEDPAVAKRRARWTALATAAAAPDANASALLSAENAALIADWEKNRSGDASRWSLLEVLEWHTSDDSLFRWLPDGSLNAVGPRPEKDIYTVKIPGPLTLSAIRLDVLTDPSFSKNGPGRQENGNLHLSEFEARVEPTTGGAAKRIKIRRAVADWNQEGWSINKALDGNEKTAWGIYPKVGQPHAAVFELEQKLAVAPGENLVVVLKQLHGGGHLIGRFKLSATNDPSPSAAIIPFEVADALQTPAEKRSHAQRLAIAAFALRHRAESELAALPAPLKVYAAGAGIAKADAPATPPRGQPKEVHVLERGDVNKPGAIAKPGTISCVSALPSRFVIADLKDESARRAALADWLADEKNPLTWRSIANRVWQDHFGRGICDSPSDLGRMGGVPSHPQLLDWLACEVRENGGSLKKLHRLIVTSETYRQSSAHRPDAAKVDSDNRLLSRMNRNRIDAESFRDAVLAASGKLDLTMGGPGVQQFKLGPKIQDTPSLDYKAFDWDSPGACRRSIYRVVWRGIQDPFMEALDFPDAGLPAPTRAFSASPLQALAMLNNEFVLKQAEHLAKRAEQSTKSPEEQIEAAFRFTLQRSPTSSEQARFAAYAKKHGLPAACRVLLNCNEFLFVD
jgi:hypothetical protein